ncbi:hypothetical protein MJ561_09070 [Klebsiella pneumoniae]|nr:hypothetical protein MJ561_09070 [Klebsiella pneumoniae]
MKLIADVNFDMSYSFNISPLARSTRRPIWSTTCPEADKKQRLYILQERINQQAITGHRMLGTVQHPGGRHLA